MRIRLLAIALLLLAFVAPRPASAGNIEKAKAAFAEARERARTGNFKGALESIAEVERHMKHPTVSLLKVRSLRKLWRLDHAAAALKEINPSKLKRSLRAVLAEEQGKLDKLLKSHGHLKVTVKPAEAVIVIEGKTYKGTVDRWFPAGKVRMELGADLHQAAVRQATLMAGEMREIKVKLRAAAGTIRLQVPGGLKGVIVRLDGKQIDIDDGARAGDMTSIRTSVGAHEIICARGKFRDAKVIKVELSKTVAVACDELAPSKLGRTVLGWGGLATGVAVAGYGVWGIASYFSDASQADDNLKNATAADLINGMVPEGGIDTNKHWGGALYLVSGLAVSTVSYLFFVRKPAADSSSAATHAPALAGWPLPAAAPGATQSAFDRH